MLKFTKAILLFLSLSFLSSFVLSVHPAAQHSIAKTSSTSNWNPNAKKYPIARKDDTKFHFQSAKHPGGVSIIDPYTWMESSSSNEIKTFLQSESKLTNSFIEKCDKQKIKETIKITFDFLSFASLQQFGSLKNPFYLYSFDDKNNLNPKWFLVTDEELNESKKLGFPSPPGKLIFDEGTLSPDYSLQIKSWDIRKDQSLAIFNVVSNSSSEIRFLDLTESKKYSNLERIIIPNAGLNSLMFTIDEKGILYDLQDPNFGGNSRIAYHIIGTQPEKDLIIVSANNDISGNSWTIDYSLDQKWLIATASDDNNDGVLFMSSTDQTLNQPEKIKWLSILPNYEGYMQYMQNFGNDFFFISTQEGAVDYKIVKVLVDPSKAKIVKSLFELKDNPIKQPIIPEKKKSPLDFWLILQEKVVLMYLEKAKEYFYIFDLKTGKQIQQILQDFNGNVHLSTFASNSNQGFIDTDSFFSGSQIFRIKLQDDGKVNITVALESKPKGIDVSTFKTEQLFGTNKRDGTQIPFTMMYGKDYKFDGKGTAWLYFYGTFGFNSLPSYDPYLLAWIYNFGGVFAYAQPRGGAELGLNWYNAGTNQSRHNTYDDIVAVIQEMVNKKICGQGKVILYGYGPQGEISMAIANQNPQGFLGAIVSANGIFDLIRLNNSGLSVDAIIQQWGDVKNPKDFDIMYSESPYQNVDDKKQYPSILLSADPNGDIGISSQVYKMIAELQSTHEKNENPLLLYLDPIPQNPTTQQSYDANIDLGAVQQCFVSQALGLKMIR